MVKAMILSSILVASTAWLLTLAYLRRDRGQEGRGGAPAIRPTATPGPRLPATEPWAPSSRVESAKPSPATHRTPAMDPPATHRTPAMDPPAIHRTRATDPTRATDLTRATDPRAVTPEPVTSRPKPILPAQAPSRYAARSTRNNGFSRFASQPGVRAARHR